MENIKTALGIDEMKDCKTLTKQLFAEFIGTFLYISIVLLAGTNIGANNVATAFANGLLVATIVQIIGHISGGHINPAVTVGALVCGHIKVLRAFAYILVQIVGSIVASIVSYYVTEDKTRGNLGATVPYHDIRADQIFALEFLMTFILVAVVLSVVDPNRGAKGLGSAALAIGLSITACQCSCVTYTGSLNPVRSLGPAVVMNVWDKHYVFWIGPLLGGLFAGITYKFIFTVKTNNYVE